VSAVTVRWHDDDSVAILVDDLQVLSVSNLDEHGGRDGESSVAYAAQVTAEAVGRVLGCTVTVERPVES
jgi:hypothetical protein